MEALVVILVIAVAGVGLLLWHHGKLSGILTQVSDSVKQESDELAKKIKNSAAQVKTAAQELKDKV